MGFVVTSAQTQQGVGPERFYGQAVQAAYGVDVVTASLPPVRGVAMTEANRNTPSGVSDMVAAATEMPGSLTFDMRPNGGCLRIIGGGYYLDPTQSTSPTIVTNFTGTTAIGSPTVTAVSSVAGLVVGQPITGTGIPALTTIIAIGTTTITLSANATAAGTPTLTQTVTYYVHKLIPALGAPSALGSGIAPDNPFTFISKEGSAAQFVTNGCKVDSITLACDKTQTTPFRANVAFRALNRVAYPANTTQDNTFLGMGSLSYDTGKWGPTDWSLSFGGITSPNAKSFTHTFNRNLEPKHVGDGYIGPQLHFPKTANTTLTVQEYWADLNELYTFYNQLATANLPFGQNKTIATTNVTITLGVNSPKNVYGFVNTLQLVYPVASIVSLTKDLPDQGPVMLDLAIQPRQDPANNYIDHYLLWTTLESATVISTPSNEIAYFPKNDFFPYNCVSGIATGTPTTTVIAAAPTATTATTTNGSNILTAVASVSNLSVGQTIAGTGIPTGSTITQVGTNTVTISANATATGSGIAITASYLNGTTDSTYNTLTLQFITGVNKGLQRTISAYTASTRTFTVSVAFPSAPAAADQFIVIGGAGL
jgi:hypothetical protein